MALRDAIDLTALGWVKPDLDELLRQARVAIEASEGVDTGVDAHGMRDCADLLHQARGTLRMLELTVPALVAEEMERVAGALADGAASEPAQALGALHRGVLLLPDYLERLQAGHREIPIVLLPLINELRGTRGADPLGEAALFDVGLVDASANALPAPTQAEIDHAQGSLSGHNRSVLDAVSNVLKEDLHRIQDALDLYLRGGRGELAELAPQVDALDRAADTMAMLGLGPVRQLLQDKRDELRALVAGERAGEAELMGVASALLQAHAALEQQVQDLAAAQDEQGAQTLEHRDLVAALAREAVGNFSSVRQGLVAFVESTWEHEQLAELPRLFAEVSGALRMLEMPEPAATTEALGAYVERELLRPSAIPGVRQLDTLADAISSLEYCLEMLAARGELREDILEITHDSLESLGYWPLPDDAPQPQREAAHEDAAAEPAAEADSGQSQTAPATDAEDAPPPMAAAVAPVASTAAPSADNAAQGGFDLAGEDIDDEIREVFLEEFAEEIDNLGELIPDWHAAPDNLERLRPIRRVFHTLKGSGRLVGATSLGEFSWKIENMLNRVLDESRPGSPAVHALVDHAHALLPHLHAALRGEALQGVALGEIAAVAERLAAGEEVDYVPSEAPTVPEPAAQVDDGIAASVEPVLLEVLDAEVGGHLQTMDAWIAGAGNDGRVDDALMRAVHTMSGAFAMAEVPAIGEVLLPAEGLIKRLLAAGQAADADVIEALTDLGATVRTTLAALQTESPKVRPQPELAERIKRLRDALPEPSPEAPRHAREEAERLEAERLEADRLEAERVEAERLEAERVEAERLEAERLEAERLEAERLEAERLEAERLEAERLEAERLEAERLEAERLEAERLEAERLEAERLEAERLEAERLEAERLEAERLEAERLEAERLEAERVEAERVEAERVEAERLEAERLEAERLEAERLEAERLEAERLEAERLEAERLEAERLEAERLEAERLEAERLEAERLEAERLEAERLEAERLDAERLEAERLEAERLEAERLEAERLEAERLEAERLEAERLEAERLEAERLEAERLEAERLEAERLEAERLEAERLEAERLEAERLEAERLEAERLEAERLEAERLEAERLEAERLEAERLEAERLEAEAAAQAEVATDDASDPAAAAVQARIDELEARIAQMQQSHAPARAIKRVEKELDGQRTQLAALLAGVSSEPDADVPEPAHADQGQPQHAGEDEQDQRPLDVSDLDLELVDIFVEESGDLLDHSDGLVAELRSNPDNRDALIGLQRDLHTIKGGARMAGIMAVGELGHAMEGLLEAAAGAQLRLDPAAVALLEQGYDQLHGMVTRIEKRLAIEVPDALVAAFAAIARGEDPTAAVAEAPAADVASQPVAATPEPQTFSEPLALQPEDDDMLLRAPQEQVRIRADLLDRLVNYAGEVAIYRARLEQQLGAFRAAMQEMEQTNTRLHDQLRRLDIETEAQIIARYQREHDSADATFDPLELDRFSTLQQLSRALNESAADMSSLQGTLDELTRQYETLLLQQSRVSSDLQEGLMRTRMVPFSGLVPRLRRVLRQAAAETGKKVQLHVDGTQGELDRSVLDRMAAPLEHMLRNAVAHGVESVQARAAAGKPEEAVVSIGVRTEGSEVVLQVADDGAGLDRAAIRQRAIDRGLIAADAELRDEVLDTLIMQPGFSTVDSVSRLAGRGVGMDVVASEVRQLGGSIDIRSEPGQGSRFVLRLPQTLAVTQAVFVRIGETVFAVPIASVRGVGRISREALASGEASYRYGGDDYQVHDLGVLLGQAPARADGHLQMPLLLVGSGEMRIAVTIDEVIGNREIVVKPVGPQVASLPGIFGATIMGDGSVVVILDIAPLVRRRLSAPAQVLEPQEPAPRQQVPLVMVVDDSVTMRKVTGRVLERNGYEVVTARDGIDALERMVERVPDLMLLDIEMPRMDGYELATEMRTDARLRDVPIMMITSRTGEKHRQRAFDIGVKRYLGKPYQEPELMRNVEELLEAAGHAPRTQNND